MVHTKHRVFGVWITWREQGFDPAGPVLASPTLVGADAPAASERFPSCQESLGHVPADPFLVDVCGLTRPGGSGSVVRLMNRLLVSSRETTGCLGACGWASTSSHSSQRARQAAFRSEETVGFPQLELAFVFTTSPASRSQDRPTRPQGDGAGQGTQPHLKLPVEDGLS